MKFANGFKIENHADHFLIRLGVMTEDGEESEETLVLPVTVGARMGTALLFETFKAIPALQHEFVLINAENQKLDELAKQQKAEKDKQGES